jgi:hypothetical protein
MYKFLIQELTYASLHKAVGSVHYYFVKRVVTGAARTMEISTSSDEAQHYKKEQHMHLFYGFVVIQVCPQLLARE